jgi:LacI family transcriptional regulator
MAARALVRRRSGLIGLIAGALDPSWMAPAVAALDQRLSDAGWGLLLSSCAKEGAPLAHARALVGRGVEALVFLEVAIPTDLASTPGIGRMPCVSLDRTDDTGFIENAGLDLARAGKLISDYLLQLGHRHFGVVAEPESVIGALLGNAVVAACVSSGLTLRRLNIADGPVGDGMLKWLALPNAPTAAICSSDAVALAVMHACASRGVEVPARLSVTGFGDTPLTRWVSPMLTSVRIPARGAGLAAAEYLLARLEGRVPARAELAVKLAVRGSTGAPRV